jgi:hypothetical protein
MRPIAGSLVCLLASVIAAAGAELRTRNVILVTIDGLRWQEVFRGADEALMDKAAGGVPENVMARLRRDYLGATPEERRRRLMPFFWDTLVPQGLAYGNRDLGSPARVTNEQWISYPGYNEMLTGRPDPKIVNNAGIPNPNVTVLEWLNARPGFAGRVAACAAWRRFSAILNVERSRLPLFVTPQRSEPGTVSPRIAELEHWMEDIPPITADEHFDIFVYHAAVETVDARRPRVLLFALGEPDEWGHARRYDRYLDSIRRCDRLLQQLWEKLQTLPEYRGTTTLVLTTDHGRGPNSGDWVRHNRSTPGSDETWLAALGPDTPALGERRDTPPVHQAQVAATVAALLGEDFRAAAPAAAPPIAEVLGGSAGK